MDVVIVGEADPMTVGASVNRNRLVVEVGATDDACGFGSLCVRSGRSCRRPGGGARTPGTASPGAFSTRWTWRKTRSRSSTSAVANTRDDQVDLRVGLQDEGQIGQVRPGGTRCGPRRPRQRRRAKASMPARTVSTPITLGSAAWRARWRALGARAAAEPSRTRLPSRCRREQARGGVEVEVGAEGDVAQRRSSASVGKRVGAVVGTIVSRLGARAPGRRVGCRGCRRRGVDVGSEGGSDSSSGLTRPSLAENGAQDVDSHRW